MHARHFDFGSPLSIVLAIAFLELNTDVGSPPSILLVTAMLESETDFGLLVVTL